jgi:AraC-like DNA-binding protein
MLNAFTHRALGEVLTPGELEALRAERGLSAQNGERDDRMPYDVAAELWQLLSRKSGDRDFGLHFAERLAVKDLGVVGYLAATADDLAASLDRVFRFHRLLKDPAEMVIETTASAIRIVEGPPPGAASFPRHLAEMILASYVVIFRGLTGSPIRACRVSFQHPSPGDTTEHLRIFGSPPLFDAADNELVLPAEVGQLGLRTADPVLSTYLERLADAELSALTPPDPLLVAVASEVRAALPDGYPSIQRVARKLGLSARSLQRRLEERRANYQQIVDRVRLDTARRLLADSSLSVAQIAFLTGFSDTTGFNRAFRRWTGQNPRRRSD